MLSKLNSGFEQIVRIKSQDIRQKTPALQFVKQEFLFLFELKSFLIRLINST